MQFEKFHASISKLCRTTMTRVALSKKAIFLSLSLFTALLPLTSSANSTDSDPSHKIDAEYVTNIQVYHHLNLGKFINVYCISDSCIKDIKPHTSLIKLIALNDVDRFKDSLSKLTLLLSTNDDGVKKELRTATQSDDNKPTIESIRKEWKDEVFDTLGRLDDPRVKYVVAIDENTNLDEAQTLYNSLREYNKNTVALNASNPLFYADGLPEWSNAIDVIGFYVDYVLYHMENFALFGLASIPKIIVFGIGIVACDLVIFMIMGVMYISPASIARKWLASSIIFTSWTCITLAISVLATLLAHLSNLRTNANQLEILADFIVVSVSPAAFIFIATMFMTKALLSYTALWIDKEPAWGNKTLKSILASTGLIRVETQPLRNRFTNDDSETTPEPKSFITNGTSKVKLAINAGEHQEASINGSELYKQSKNYVPHQGFLLTGHQKPRYPENMFELSEKWLVRSNHKEFNQDSFVVTKNNIASTFYDLYQDVGKQHYSHDKCSYWLTPFIEFESHGFIKSHADNQMLDVEFGLSHINFEQSEIASVNISRRTAKVTKLTSDVLALLVDVEEKECAPVEIYFGVTTEGEVAVSKVKRQSLDSSVSKSSQKNWREFCKSEFENDSIKVSEEIGNDYSNLGRSVLSMISTGAYHYQGDVQYRVANHKAELLSGATAIRARVELLSLLDRVEHLAPYIGVRGILEQTKLILKPVMSMRSSLSLMDSLNDNELNILRSTYHELRRRGKLLPYLDVKDDYYDYAADVFPSGIAITESLLMIGVSIIKSTIEAQYSGKECYDVAYEALAISKDDRRFSLLKHQPNSNMFWWENGEKVTSTTRYVSDKVRRENRSKSMQLKDLETYLDDKSNKGKKLNVCSFIGIKIPKPLESTLSMFGVVFLRDTPPNTHLQEMMVRHGVGLYVGKPNYDHQMDKLKE